MFAKVQILDNVDNSLSRNTFFFFYTHISIASNQSSHLEIENVINLCDRANSISYKEDINEIKFISTYIIYIYI